MKKKILSLIIVTLFFVITCKESTTEPEPEKINDKYYVINNAAIFVYSLSITDTNGITINGNRYLSFDDSTLVGPTYYKNQIDSFETFLPFDTLTTTSISYIRQTNHGVYTFADTTGFIDFLPDSLKQYLKADIDTRLLFYPLSTSQPYSVYTLSLSQFIIGINVIDVDAIVESKDSLELNVNGALTQFSAFKIKYDLVIRTSSSNEIIFTAYGCAVKDLGFVRWDGDAEVFNFLLNENIFPPETNVKMDLTQYSIP
jgi:hypothetical protein